MSAKRVQDIFHGLRNLERTPSTGTFRLTKGPMKLLEQPDSLRKRLDSVRPSSAWDIHVGKLHTEGPNK